MIKIASLLILLLNVTLAYAQDAVDSQVQNFLDSSPTAGAVINVLNDIPGLKKYDDPMDTTFFNMTIIAKWANPACKYSYQKWQTGTLANSERLKWLYAAAKAELLIISPNSEIADEFIKVCHSKQFKKEPLCSERNEEHRRLVEALDATHEWRKTLHKGIELE